MIPVSLWRYGLYHRMVIRPSFFEAVREIIDGLPPFRSPDQKPSSCSTDPTNQPEKILHLSYPSRTPSNPFDLPWMRRTRDAFGPSLTFSVVPDNRYTYVMDSVRFGRALGTGARLAAKTLVTAADAATSPNPSSRPASASGSPQASDTAARSVASARRVGNKAAQTADEVCGATRGIARGTRRFGEATWRPFVRLSGVLWLELTGVFFGLFALSAGVGVWKLRSNLHSTGTNADGQTHLALAAGIAILFGYFCVTSFVRANRRERRR